jgi:hypothetical protein
MQKNKFEVFATVDPSEFCGEGLLEDYIRNGMIMELAYEVAKDFPSEINRQTVCQVKGTSLEEHKMTLFIFSEQQMEEHDKEIRKNAYLSLAVDRALHTLGEKVCH